MDIITWLVVGGLVGWVASMVMRTDGQQGVLLNVAVGVVGAALGGWLLAPQLGPSTINEGDFSGPGLLISLFGAVILLGIVSVFRRGAIQ